MADRAPADPEHEALAAGLPGEWVKAAESWYSMHGSGLVRNLIAGVAPLIRAAERERIAARMDELASNYPEDVFPPDSDVRDGISGTAMRHAYRNAAREVREADHG
jgi:hypothetical protein